MTPKDKIPPHEPRCCHPKDGTPTAEIPQDSQPNFEQQTKLSNRKPRSTLIPCGMMPVHRDRNTSRNIQNGNAGSLGAATTAAPPDNSLPLDRWLSQTMADEPYNTLGFVQAVGDLDQWYTPSHDDAPCRLDATAASGADQDPSQMDVGYHKQT
ncbi:uncharacterized protein E0L32_003161 [Thyridium curvatum]|uniref:Uncharacterized protein n=1 Tax=Thyridium curvatum TaxID=1093900 RepID=A0A507BLG6_9PEZI|nr:uncharacterized protein E0L32_003161 [Thyridium curvatum]TPX17518.1 hypothetical protein E0L32_003161 [Thyridium curvatum]